MNISSTEGIAARPYHFAYVTSKAAVAGLTRSVAIDLGRKGVRCNAISPGSIESERFRKYVGDKPELEQELIGYNSRNRIGRPQEVAACCVYLISDDSGFVNGADYIIDGGRTAGSSRGCGCRSSSVVAATRGRRDSRTTCPPAECAWSSSTPRGASSSRRGLRAGDLAMARST